MRGVEEVVAADEEDRDPDVVVVAVAEVEGVVEAVGEVDAWVKTLYNANWKSC